MRRRCATSARRSASGGASRDGPVDEWERERDAIGEQIELRGWNERIRSYVAVFDGDEVDASLLLLGIAGYVDPGSPRMIATCERVIERLGVNGLLYRYVRADGLPPGEGAFGICSFWNAEESALRGEAAEARRECEHVLSFANDVGLFSEEIDPETGELLGNFPQAFTHVGLIDAALAIAAAESDAPVEARVESEERQERES
jgi:GH15 family glucan-1,4-alpha-glucosidase